MTDYTSHHRGTLGETGGSIALFIVSGGTQMLTTVFYRGKLSHRTSRRRFAYVRCSAEGMVCSLHLLLSLVSWASKIVSRITPGLDLRLHAQHPLNNLVVSKTGRHRQRNTFTCAGSAGTPQFPDLAKTQRGSSSDAITSVD